MPVGITRSSAKKIQLWTVILADANAGCAHSASGTLVQISSPVSNAHDLYGVADYVGGALLPFRSRH